MTNEAFIIRFAQTLLAVAATVTSVIVVHRALLSV